MQSYISPVNQSPNPKAFTATDWVHILMHETIMLYVHFQVTVMETIPAAEARFMWTVMHGNSFQEIATRFIFVKVTFYYGIGANGSMEIGWNQFKFFWCFNFVKRKKDPLSFSRHYFSCKHWFQTNTLMVQTKCYHCSSLNCCMVTIRAACFHSAICV